MLGFFRKLSGKAEPAEGGIVFEVQWGGYYTYKDNEGKYKVWRLLDFNKDAVHFAYSDAAFDHKPSLAEAQASKWPMPHVPQAVGVLPAQADLTLLGHDPLTEDDLAGYADYLEHANGLSQGEVRDMLQKITSYSQEDSSHMIIEPDYGSPSGVKVRKG